MEETEKKKLVIDRRTWYRGQGSDDSFLFNYDSEKGPQMCCLGFYALQCGIPLADVNRKRVPNDLGTDIDGELDGFTIPEEFQWLQEKKGLSEALMKINDNKDLQDEDRALMIRDIFESQGVEVVFIN